MKAETRPRYEEGILLPESKWGVKILSMGFFQQNDEEAIIWRGPMIHNALTQFLESTDSGDLDYLVTDLPPGTSDAPLTIMQTLPLDGFVAVTTPQELALTDAKRSINMVRKMNLPILGVVENLAGEIFGAGAGEALADQMDLEFLGRLNLRPDYRDTSKPTVLLSDQVRDEYQIIVSNIENRLSQTASTA